MNMVITYNGEGYFKLQSGDKAILIDPDNQRSFKGSLAVISTVKPAKVSPEEEGPFFIENQGEYDVAEIRIEGRTVFHEDGFEKTAYRIYFDEIEIGVLGPVKKEPDPKSIEILQDCDILILPGGEEPFIGAGITGKIVRQTEPGIVIPSFTKNPKGLVKELGQENNMHPEEKLTIKKKEITPKGMVVKWLSS